MCNPDISAFNITIIKTNRVHDYILFFYMTLFATVFNRGYKRANIIVIKVQILRPRHLLSYTNNRLFQDCTLIGT